MNSELIMVVFVLISAVIVLLIAKLASFLRGFFEETRNICYEMDHADDYEEYRRWRGELRCHYLMLIPFVTEKNVMRVYSRIFHKGDNRKNKERGDSIVQLLIPSVLGICVCLVCICSMTWAWYSASVKTPTQKMNAAYYEVVVVSVVDNADESKNRILPADGGYSLDGGKTYTVTLSALGSVKECGGYCLIERIGADGKEYTQSIKPGVTIDINFSPSESGIYTFTGVWGSHPIGTPTDTIIEAKSAEKGGTEAPSGDVPSTTAPVIVESAPSTNAPEETTAPAETTTATPSVPAVNTYVVQSGDTLTGIADKYNTTPEKLAAYNGIADTSLIKIGQVLNIPPQNYEIP